MQLMQNVVSLINLTMSDFYILSTNYVLRILMTGFYMLTKLPFGTKFLHGKGFVYDV